MHICIQCGQALIGRQQRFCSHKCNDIWWLIHKKSKQIKCIECGKECRVSKNNVKNLCRSCINKKRKFVPLSRYGETNPNWKGGHKYWNEGRFGKDKNGLSWKIQRRLARERDNYICQICHIKKNKNPDVHHIVPYRLSFSHSLDNLICLCASCHKKEEAKNKELWGGKTIGTYLCQFRTIQNNKTHNAKVKILKPKCSICGKSGVKLNKMLECKPCFYEKIYINICQEYRAGKSRTQLMQEYHVSERTIYYWLKGQGPSYRGCGVPLVSPTNVTPNYNKCPHPLLNKN